MILLDASVLLYAYNADAPEHRAAFQWLSGALAGDETIGIPWLTSWAFLRISTNPRLFASPLTAAEALAIVNQLLAEPGVTIPEPGSRHAGLLQKVVEEYRTAGPNLTDAVMVALALEHGAVLASADLGFGRFKGVRWLNPVAK